MIIKETKELERLLKGKQGRNPLEVKKEIQQMMWMHAGVVRNEKGLLQALKAIEWYRKISLKVKGSLKRNMFLLAALDVKNMLPTCEMILKSALARKESRGAHYRSDYPATEPAWKKNVVCMPTKKGVEITAKSIKDVPLDVQYYIDNHPHTQTNLLE